MRLRFLLAYSLLLVAVGPLFDHHTPERDPFHSHLAQTALAGHRHGLDPLHAHAAYDPENPGAIALHDGSAAPPAVPAVAGVSLMVPTTAASAIGTISTPVRPDAPSHLVSRFPLLPDPPPRLPL